jgi:RNA polymerase sigma factor (sigma-70 family)
MADSNPLNCDWRSWLERQFADHAALVRAVIWNRLGRVRDPHQVEELAGETWARVVRGVRGQEFDPDRDFAPWACAIAVNVCREHLRRLGRHTAPDGLPEPDDLPDPHAVGRTQELLELYRALAECLAGLGAADREVYERRFEQGLSGRAAAAALGVPESTFREKLLPGLLAKLARCLGRKGFDAVPSGCPARQGLGPRTAARGTP